MESEGKARIEIRPQTLALETDCFVALVATLAAALCFIGAFFTGVMVFLATCFFPVELRSCFAAAAYAHVNDE